jgi:hypothetical protein
MYRKTALTACLTSKSLMVYVQFLESDTGVSKAKDVPESESCGIVPSPTSAGVVANVPRRDGSVGSVNKAKSHNVMEYNTPNEQIEHFVHTISTFAVLLGISFLIIGYAMGANAIHSTFSNVPEGLLLIGLTLTAKHKRILATNLEGVETIGCTSCTCSEMGTLTQNNFMNGTATSTLQHYFALCVVAVPASCLQAAIDIHLFVLNSKHGRSDVMV